LRRPRLAGALSVAAVLAVAGSAGCGKPVLRIADPSLGDYYSEEEFRKLRGDQRDEYCAEMARQDSVYRAAIADLGEALDATEARRAAVGVEADSLERLAEALESRPATDRPPAGEVTPSPGAEPPGGVHVVAAGESLWRIAAAPARFGDGRQWRRIYEANRDRIRDPDLIHPGQELQIPK